jgi:hypothetical protein
MAARRHPILTLPLVALVGEEGWVPECLKLRAADWRVIFTS